MKSRSLASNGARLAALLVVVLGAVAFAAWRTSSSKTEQLYGSFSAPTFASIEELTASADVVIEGVVLGVAGREMDYGTADPSERAEAERTGGLVPFVFYEVQVTDELKGATPDVIIVGNVDGERLISAEVTPLRPGERVILFLVWQVSAEDSPGLSLFDSYYTILSLDAGVFDVMTNGTVQARAPENLLHTDQVAERWEFVAKVTGG